MKCPAKLSFEECEMAILREAMEENMAAQKAAAAPNGPEIQKIIGIVESFLRRKKLICYGGTAINNILPKKDRFYNRDVDIPDYDFFSPNALEDAKELARIYFRAGYKEVEARAGVHHGTYKVYVNFIPIADITFLDRVIYRELGREAVTVGAIRYASPNWLRMGMYLELSRPMGDVSRWEKVLHRLTLLNKNYPLEAAGRECTEENFQRKMDFAADEDEAELVYNTVRDAFIDEEVVFFGGYALSIYSTYMPRAENKVVRKIADFDVLCEDVAAVATIVIERLRGAGFAGARVVEHPPAGEILPKHCEIRIGADIVAFLYEPAECANFNVVTIDGRDIKVATIDTILRYYLAFMYCARPYYDRERLICMSQFLFRVQEKNRLEQKGVLRRFVADCVGRQLSLEDIRAEKAEIFGRLKGRKDSKEYEEWFLKFRPEDEKGARRGRTRRGRAAARRTKKKGINWGNKGPSAYK